MGAPVFTAAELRRAAEVASEFGWIVEVCPRRGTIRLVPQEPGAVASQNSEIGENTCDGVLD